MKEYTATVVREGLGFGEAPRWHEGRLWYSDFYRHGIYSMATDGTDEVSNTRSDQPSGLGWLPDGDLLCVSMTSTTRSFVSRRRGERRSPTSADYCGFWANDMVVSSSGYSYVGNFGFDLDTVLADLGVEGFLAEPPPTTNLVVLDAEGDVIQVVPDMAFPNGTVITPDGATLIVGETVSSRLTAFDVARRRHALRNRRVWARSTSSPPTACVSTPRARSGSPTRSRTVPASEGRRRGHRHCQTSSSAPSRACSVARTVRRSSS